MPTPIEAIYQSMRANRIYSELEMAAITNKDISTIKAAFKLLIQSGRVELVGEGRIRRKKGGR